MGLENLPAWICFILQTFGILYSIGLIALAFVITVTFYNHCQEKLPKVWSSIDVFDGKFSIFGIFQPIYLLFWQVTFSILVIASKWIIIGRYRTGCYGLKSIVFIRWWVVDRLLHNWEFWVGNFYLDTPVIILFYKLMGMNISLGASVLSHIREFDLVSIGYGTSISGRLFPRLIRPQKIFFDSISIGNFVEVNAQTVVHPGVIIEDKVIVEKLSVLMEKFHLKARTKWGGNPAEQLNENIIISTMPLGIKHYLFEYSKLLVLTLAAIILWGCQITIQVILYKTGYFNVTPFRYQILIYYILEFGGIFYLFALVTILTKWMLLGKVRPGLIRSSHWRKWRVWCVNFFGGIVLGSLFIIWDKSYMNNLWMWLLGSKIGKGVSFTVCPVATAEADLLEVDDYSFISFASVSCTRKSTQPGIDELMKVKLGKNCWIGLQANVSAGVTIESGSGIGVITSISAGTKISQGIIAYGNPMILLHSSAEKTKTESFWKTLSVYFGLSIAKTLMVLPMLACLIPPFEIITQIGTADKTRVHFLVLWESIMAGLLSLILSLLLYALILRLIFDRYPKPSYEGKSLFQPS